MNPKYSLNMQNKEDSMTRFRKIGRNVDFWPKMAIFLPKKGPKRVKNFDVRILNSFFSLINSKLSSYKKT